MAAKSALSEIDKLELNSKLLTPLQKTSATVIYGYLQIENK
jgi:hypothetical protein